MKKKTKKYLNTSSKYLKNQCYLKQKIKKFIRVYYLKFFRSTDKVK